LTPDEHLLYLHLIDPAWKRVRRVEQERMPLHVAAESLHRAWKPACGERRIVQMILAGKSGLVPFAGCRGLEVSAVTSMGFREVRA